MTLRQGRERPEKILVAMHAIAGSECQFLKYEDIVVKAFRMFPDEFAIRGYPEYPDSSDIHKPLYGILKRKGLIKVAAKTFALTPRGIEIARRLTASAGKSLEQVRNGERMERNELVELDHLLRSPAYQFFTENEQNRILDTDFYTFLGCTVRTGKNDFRGRLQTVTDVIETAKRLGQPDRSTGQRLHDLLSFLLKNFRGEIEAKENHG